MQQRLTHAMGFLEQREARRAIETVQAASDMAHEIIGILETYTGIRAGIVQGRNDAERLAAEGYRMEASSAALDRTQVALGETASALQSGEEQSVSRAREHLQSAQAALSEAVANGRDLVALRAENERRLAEIEKRGKETAQAVVEGRKTFDIVDEFAESTWSDIRGNGGQAQALVTRVRQRWHHAARANSMEVQEFADARAELDAASDELYYARQLIDAINQRLKALEEARDTARKELEDADHDIKRGWEFIHSNDPDVGKVPEHQLHEAAQLLGVAQAEMQKAKPDWLLLVQKAQAANNLADEALAGARSEAEAMNKLRDKAQRAEKVAGAEVARIARFAELHGEDIEPDHQRELEALQRQEQDAAALIQRAHESEEDERRQALEQAHRSYTSITEKSHTLYEMMQTDVQRLEQLRKDLSRGLAAARNAIRAADSQLAQASSYGFSEERRRLDAVRRQLDDIRFPIRGERNLRSTISMVRAQQSEADSIRDALQRRSQHRRRHPHRRHPHRRHHDHDSGIGDIATGIAAGMIIDSIFDSMGNGGGGGGGDSDSGWGGFGGGGDFDWGGGGGGGFDWGGGDGGDFDW